jgi:hypothetical protein
MAFAFRPVLNKEHEYAVGLMISGAGVAPIETYSNQEELEEGFARWYKTAVANKISRPVALQKLVEGQEWDEAQCRILGDLMQRIIDTKI